MATDTAPGESTTMAMASSSSAIAPTCTASNPEARRVVRARRMPGGSYGSRNSTRLRLGAGSELAVHVGHLLAGGLEGQRVVHHEVGALALFVQRELRRDSALGLGLAEPVTLNQALDLGRPIDPDHDYRLDNRGAAILVEQRDVYHQDAVLRLASRNLLCHSRLDAWVGDGVEPGPGGGVAEDQVAQPWPIQHPIFAQELAAERVDDLLEGRLAGHHHLARQLIRVDHLGAQVGEHSRDRGLSRPQATRQTEDSHQPESTATSSHLGRGCGRSGRRLVRALAYRSTDMLARVLVASFGSSRPASQSASPGR